MKTVTAVVVTHNSARDIEDCIRGMAGHPEVDICVVDSGSSDDTADRVRAFSGVQLIVAGENIGWTAATNRALARIDSEFVAFVNPDARPSAPQLLELTNRFGPSTGAVALSASDSPFSGDSPGCCWSSRRYSSRRSRLSSQKRR